jgi:hypothetical protein
MYSLLLKLKDIFLTIKEESMSEVLNVILDKFKSFFIRHINLPNWLKTIKKRVLLYQMTGNS